MSEMKKKMAEILDHKTVIDSKVLAQKDIYDLENRFQIELPKEYKEFLIHYKECYIKDNYQFPMIEKSVLTPSNGFETMDFFYGVNLIPNAEEYLSLYGNEMIPIGEAGGDVICMGMKKDIWGQIFYLYHESEEEKMYFLIAHSFHEFILSFEKKEEKSINLDEIEIYLDDDLWND